MFTCTVDLQGQILPAELATVTVAGEAIVEHARELYEQLVTAFSKAKAVRLVVEGVDGADLSLVQLVLSAGKTASESKRIFSIEGALSNAYEKALEEAGVRRPA